MKKILLSTSLVSLLFLTGCGDTTKTTPALSTTSRYQIQTVKPINIVEGHKKVASFSADSSSRIDYTIVAGDTLYFEVIDNTLYFKNPQRFLEGGDNQYKLEVLAKRSDISNAKATKLMFTINITKQLGGGQIVVTDRIAPVINPTVSATVDTDITLATDNVAVTTLTLTGADATHFTVNGTTVRTPATAGVYHIAVTAKDFANNTTTQNVTVTVTNVAQTGSLTWSAVEDNRYSWDEANNICNAMTNGSWRLPTISELSAYSDTLHAQLPTSATGSVIWSSDDATAGENGAMRKFGWGYFLTPADSSAQLASERFYFTCVKSN